MVQHTWEVWVLQIMLLRYQCSRCHQNNFHTTHFNNPIPQALSPQVDHGVHKLALIRMNKKVQTMMHISRKRKTKNMINKRDKLNLNQVMIMVKKFLSLKRGRKRIIKLIKYKMKSNLLKNKSLLKI